MAKKDLSNLDLEEDLRLIDCMLEMAKRSFMIEEDEQWAYFSLEEIQKKFERLSYDLGCHQDASGCGLRFIGIPEETEDKAEATA